MNESDTSLANNTGHFNLLITRHLCADWSCGLYRLGPSPRLQTKDV
jgi:hypothetical protein